MNELFVHLRREIILQRLPLKRWMSVRLKGPADKRLLCLELAILWTRLSGAAGKQDRIEFMLAMLELEIYTHNHPFVVLRYKTKEGRLLVELGFWPNYKCDPLPFSEELARFERRALSLALENTRPGVNEAAIVFTGPCRTENTYLRSYEGHDDRPFGVVLEHRSGFIASR